MAQTLTFENSPDPNQSNLQLIEHERYRPQDDEVLVRMIAAPINPLDILVLEDKYPVKPQSTEQGRPIAGYDGVAEIAETGREVKHLLVGDRVIIKRHGLGTWRSCAIFQAKDVSKIPKDMDPIAAALLRMGILMAHLMLQENSSMVQPGDWIIMNAATGVVPHFLGQFARMSGLKVISVVRDRPDIGQVSSVLQNHGADLVISESELANNHELHDKHIVLAFDAVFGTAGQKLISMLSPGGVYVSYGFLGGLGPASSISISQPLIFIRNITFKAFRLSAALASLSDAELEKLCAWMSDLLKERALTMPLINPVQWDAKSPNEASLLQAIDAANCNNLGQHKSIFVFSD